jgi:hypothetical protein
MEVMKFDLDWPVIMLSFAIGLACGDAKNVEMEASPATNELLNLHSCIQDMAAKVLTFLVFHIGNCYLILEGVCSLIPTSMESIEVLYVTTTSLRNDLEASFSYSPKLANEIMLSCRRRIATLNNQNRKSEVTTPMSTLQFKNCTMKGIVNDGVGMFLGIAEETRFDILDAANELYCHLAKKVTDDEIFFHMLVVESNCNMPSNNVYQWIGIEEMLPNTTMWNSLINEFAQQGMCVEVLKYFRNTRVLVHICARIFMSWFIACADPLVLPNGKEVNGCTLRSLVDRSHLFSPV